MGVGIIAFAFGVPANLSANQKIARITYGEALVNHAYVFTQKDIDYPGAERVTENPGGPPPTLRIAREAARWAQKNGFSELVVGAAGPHIWRCTRDLQKAAEELNMSIVIREAFSVRNYPQCIWFNKGSEQKRTRSRWSWWPREILLRLMPFWLYKKVAC